MKTLSRWALSCATLLALGACGNKGPLVLPEKPVPVVNPAAPADPAVDPTQPAPVGETGAAPPVQITPQNGTTAPTSGEGAANKAREEGGADGDG